MEKITKTVRCTISLDICQNMELTESEWEKLDKHLEDDSDVYMYNKVDGVLKGNDLYDLIQNQIDVKEGEYGVFEDVQIED
jgi:hypothetical protein